MGYTYGSHDLVRGRSIIQRFLLIPMSRPVPVHRTVGTATLHASPPEQAVCRVHCQRHQGRLLCGLRLHKGFCSFPCLDRYQYTELLALQRCMPAHPNRRFVEYIVSGIRDGFCVGYDYRSRCGGVLRNMQSACDHPDVVQVYLKEECAKHRVSGPFKPAEVLEVDTSRFGVIPKKGGNKWHLKLDLSSPEGQSINDGIRPDLCSLSGFHTEGGGGGPGIPPPPPLPRISGLYYDISMQVLGL